jgi:hypothetical protein
MVHGPFHLRDLNVPVPKSSSLFLVGLLFHEFYLPTEDFTALIEEEGLRETFLMYQPSI